MTRINALRMRLAQGRLSSAVLWAGALFLGLTLAAIGWLGGLAYREAFDDELARNELLARVLEDHATRTVETAAVALSSLSDLLAAQQDSDAAAIQPALRQALVGLPFLRSAAVLDRSGRVLTSTVARDAGRTIDLARLGALPATDKDSLGGVVAGRSLADLAPDAAQPARSVGFIPLSRRLVLHSGRDVVLVALINPDAISNQQLMTLADRRAGAALTSDRGQVLASTPSMDVAPGTQLRQHPVFSELLAGSEHASYLGAGVRPDTQVAAFRASRSRPLVVLVEFPQAAVRARWWREIRGFAAVSAAVLLCLSIMTWAAWRSLRAREQTRQLLDAAQAAVVQRESELRITVESVQEVIFRTDTAGVLTFANERGLALGRGAGQSGLGARLQDLVLASQRPAVQALFAATGSPVARTAHATLPFGESGGVRHFDVVVVPLAAEGRIVGFAGSAADVTERVVAQQKLQTQLSLSALLLEMSPLPISLRDLSGHYLSVNQSWEEFTGRARESAVGGARYRHLTEEDQALHRSHDDALIANGGRVRYEARMRHRDGSVRDVVMSKVRVPGDDGAPAGILSVMMDVSEFRAAERATREARDLAQEASASKTEFIANISHELRTPLQAILGFSELGVMRAQGEARVAAMFGDIQASGKRMLALVNDLLEVSKIESTVGTFHLERADLRPLVREVARELAPLLAGRRLHLDLDLPMQPLLAKVDPLRFQQVVRNVLANAVKFSPPQRQIELRGRTIGGEIHLSVRDEGPGIPPAELEHVFGAFVQSSETKDGSGGSGLGLAICRKILQAHGGHIHAENVSTGGAEFHMRLPARGSAETAPMPM